MNKEVSKRFFTIILPIVIVIEVIQIILFKSKIDLILSVVMSISYALISVIYAIVIYLRDLNRNTKKNLEVLLMFRPIAMMITFTICTFIFLSVMSAVRI